MTARAHDMMPPARSVGAVADLPDVTFGPRSIVWWGTLGFMTIEGTTLIVCAFVYLYLRKNFEAWPPLGTPLPSLGVPVAQLIVMAASVVAMYLAARAAKRLDWTATLVPLAVAILIKIPILVLRWYEFKALHTRWNSDAYGSAAWLILATHATLLVVDFAEDIGLLIILLLKPRRDEFFSDVADDAMYWYFTTGSWFLLFILVFLSPRWM